MRNRPIGGRDADDPFARGGLRWRMALRLCVGVDGPRGIMCQGSLSR